MPDSKPETDRVPMVVVPVALLLDCQCAAVRALAAPLTDGERQAVNRCLDDLRDALAAH